MPLQKTVNRTIYLRGRDPFGGNIVDVYIRPAEEDTGIVFQTPSGSIRKSIQYAFPSRRSVLLRNGNVSVIQIEHISATFSAYGVDNAVVELRRIPSANYRTLGYMRLATGTHVVPKFEDGERSLCERLDDVGLTQQTKERKILRINGKVDKGKLVFEPIDSGLVIAATTDYPIPGPETVETLITPENYRDTLSQSRPYAWGVHPLMPRWFASGLASIVFPTFGIGHGYSESNVFLPVNTLEEWRRQEIYEHELARHTIVDRLGDTVALLDGRPEGLKITAKFSNHANSIRTVKDMIKEEVFVEA